MKTNTTGIVALLFSTIFSAFYGVYARFIGLEFGSFNQLWVRYLIVAVLVSIFITYRRRWQKIRARDLPWLLTWSLSGVVSGAATFVAFNTAAIGSAYFIFYAALILVSFIVGSILFGERFARIKAVAVGLIFIGLALVFLPSLAPHFESGLFFAFLSGVSTSLWCAFSKKVSDRFTSLELTVFDAGVNVIFGLTLSWFFTQHLPSFSLSSQWFFIALYALTTIAAISLSLYGYKHVEVQLASLITPLEIVFAILVAYLIFREVPSMLGFVGGVFILIAAMLAGRKSSTG